MSLTLPTGKRRRSSSSSSSSQHDDLFDSPSPRHSPSPSLNNRIQFPQESADATAIIQASASQSQPINAIPSSSTSISKPPQPGPTVKLTSAQLRNALLQQSDVKRAASHNRDHQVKTLKLLSSIRNTYNRVQDILTRLKYADSIEEEDSELAILPYADHQVVTLPRFPKLVDSVPLLRVQADENLEYRQLATVVVWLANDVALLKKAVLTECQRIFTTQMMNDPLVTNPKELLANMSESELLIASLPLDMKEDLHRQNQSQDEENEEESQSRIQADHQEEDEDSELQVNWKTVSSMVGTHSSEDCRTKWLMTERPGLDLRPWLTPEQEQLKEIVSELYEKKLEEEKKKKELEKNGNSMQLDANGLDLERSREEFVISEERNWEEIAQILNARNNTGRNGNQCLTAYCRSTSKSRAESFSEREDEELLRLIKVLGPRWNAISDRLGTNREAYKLHHRYVTALDSTIFRGKWFSHEDENLLKALEILGQDTDDWKSVAFYVPGRNRQQCRERWKGRLSLTHSLGKEGRGSEIRRPWTKEEDDRLRECAGKDWSWVEVADYVGNRSDKQARDRFVVLKGQDERGYVKGKGKAKSSSSSKASSSKVKIPSKRKSTAADSDLETDSDEALEGEDAQDDEEEDEEPQEDIEMDSLTAESSIPRRLQLKPLSKPRKAKPIKPKKSIKPKASTSTSKGPKESRLTCPEFKPNGLPCEMTFAQFKTFQNHLKKVHKREIEEPPKMRKFESGESQAEKRRDGRRSNGKRKRTEVQDGNGDGEEDGEEKEGEEEEVEESGVGKRKTRAKKPLEKKKKVESVDRKKEREIMSWIRGRG